MNILLKLLNPFVLIANYKQLQAHAKSQRHVKEPVPYDFKNDIKYF